MDYLCNLSWFVLPSNDSCLPIWLYVIVIVFYLFIRDDSIKTHVVKTLDIAATMNASKKQTEHPLGYVGELLQISDPEIAEHWPKGYHAAKTILKLEVNRTKMQSFKPSLIFTVSISRFLCSAYMYVNKTYTIEKHRISAFQRYIICLHYSRISILI